MFNVRIASIETPKIRNVIAECSSDKGAYFLWLMIISASTEKGEKMSIILKGIDLPTNGETLIVGIYGNGLVSMEYTKPLALAIEINAEAIQIPKGHGRLIDADLLKDTVRDSVPAYTIGVKIPTFGDTQIMSAIDLMPTILEEE